MERELKPAIKKRSTAKKLTAYLLITVSIAMLTGCGGSKNVYPEQTANNNVSPTEKNTENEYPENNVSNYKEAFYYVLEDMVSQYGEYVIDPETNQVNGLKYGELIDFENDGIPEMFLVCNRTAYIYRFNGSEAEMILNEPISSGYGQTDVSYYVYVSDVDGQKYIITDHTTDEWCEDNWSSFTVREGEVYAIEFVARTDGNNDYPGIEFLSSFTINGETVTADEYLDHRATLRDNARSIDAIWDLSATYDELLAFESSLLS